MRNPPKTLDIDHVARIKEFCAFAEHFKAPHDIQLFLNEIDYPGHEVCQSPYLVMKNRTAHCTEGAYFAAAVLQCKGQKPLVLDLKAENDDDHVIALFKEGNYWGAVAKSNTTVLRYREPVFKTIRELVLSYFDMYFNTNGYKSLRGYTMPISMTRFDKLNWLTTDHDLDEPIGSVLTKAHHLPLLSSKMIKKLAPADPDLVTACFAVSNPDGLWVPE